MTQYFRASSRTFVKITRDYVCSSAVQELQPMRRRKALVMYEFNPITSLGLLQNLSQSPCQPVCDEIAHDPERRHPHETPALSLGDLFRRMIQRFSSKRRAA
jgi:hypothetical protein